jgi:hypothetical protein
MKRKSVLITLVILWILTGLVGCNSKALEKSLEEKNAEISKLEDKIKGLETQLNGINQGSLNNKLVLRLIDVVDSIKNKDMEKLASYTHPAKGLRFSPYGYIDTKTSKVFTKDEVKGLGGNSQTYTWGNYDGSGEPINLNFNDYYKKFIYDKDFANPQVIGNNTAVSQGNSLNNIKEVYPEGYFVELHFKGFDQKYSGLDWESLKLVFQEENGEWYLVSIIHDQWTI